MTHVKITAIRKTTAKATVQKVAEFDTVTGRGLNTMHPYGFAWKYEGSLLFGTSALNKMAEVGYFDSVPVLPKLPGETKEGTIWYQYPEIQPVERVALYRCHFLQAGNEALTFLPWSEQYKVLWTTLQVYEYSNTYQNNMDVVINPDYAPAKAEWDLKLAEWIAIFKRDFMLVQNYIQVTPDFLPDTTTNSQLKLQPGGTLWKWYQDGKEITVTRGQYYCPPSHIADTDHPRYLSRALDVKDVAVIARMQAILNT